MDNKKTHTLLGGVFFIIHNHGDSLHQKNRKSNKKIKKYFENVSHKKQIAKTSDKW